MNCSTNVQKWMIWALDHLYYAFTLIVVFTCIVIPNVLELYYVWNLFIYKLNSKYNKFSSYGIFPVSHFLLRLIKTATFSTFPVPMVFIIMRIRNTQAPALGWEAIGGNNSQEPKKNNPVKKGVNGAKEAFVALAAMITIFNFGWFWPPKIDKKPAGQPAKSFQTVFCSPNKT